MIEIPLSDFIAIGADQNMPWAYEMGIGDPIVYGDEGKGILRWAIGQQTRIMYPDRCTRCRNAAREGAPTEEFIGLVSVLHDRDSAESPTVWVTYCLDHFEKAFKDGRI